MEVIIISLQKDPTNTESVQEQLGLQFWSSVQCVHATSHDLTFSSGIVILASLVGTDPINSSSGLHFCQSVILKMPIRRKDAIQLTLCCFTTYFKWLYSKQLVSGHATEEQERVPLKWMLYLTHFEATVLFELLSILSEERAFILVSISPHSPHTYDTFKVWNCYFEAKPIKNMLRNTVCYWTYIKFCLICATHTGFGRIPECLTHRQGKYHWGSSKEPKTRGLNWRVALGHAKERERLPLQYQAPKFSAGVRHLFLPGVFNLQPHPGVTCINICPSFERAMTVIIPTSQKVNKSTGNWIITSRQGKPIPCLPLPKGI